MKNKILVIAPHTDDEVLGCGATLAKHKAMGDEVYAVIATNAHIGAPELFSLENIEHVRNEALAAHKILGINETIFLNFPAPALDAYPSYKISIAISDIIQFYKPTHLYLPHPGDIHIDHTSVYRASLVAARPKGNYSIKHIYCYETLSETEWSPMQGDNFFKPNHFVDVSESFDKKIEAIKCFQSQLKCFPHSRSLEALRHLAGYRGATVGVLQAEAFEVERQIL